MMKRLLFIICTLLSVQIASAQIITSKSAVVQKVEKPSYPLEKGYRGFVEASASWLGLPAQITTTHGYQINNYVYVGGGLGLMITSYYGSSVSIHKDKISVAMPIYANGRFYCTKTKVKPFFDVKLGYVVPFYWKTLVDEGPNGETCWYRNNGFYGLLGIGAEYKHFNVSLNWNPYTEEFIEWGSIRDSDHGMFNITLCLAYNF